MVKDTRLPYATPKRDPRNGKLRWYFRRGKVWRLLPGDPGNDPAAREMYWQLRSGKSLVPAGRTISDLIANYRGTPEFRKLKPRTREDYEYRLRYIEKSAGKVTVTSVTRRDVIAARDANAHRPSHANKVVAMLAILMERAIDLDWRRDNPAKGISAFKTGEGHEPWTDAQTVRFRAVTEIGAPERTAFELCRGTGQRIGDVLRMSWDDIEDGGINVVQEKTGVELWIPFTPDLAAYLAALPRGIRTTIVTKRSGGPIGYRHLHKLLARAMAAADVEGVGFHGLRKNATIELIETECTPDQIKSITGHKTDAMIRLYGAKVRQKVLAKQARAKGARRAE